MEWTCSIRGQEARRRSLDEGAQDDDRKNHWSFGEGFPVIIKKGRQHSTKENRMSLNIKDPEAHRLAQTLARETGESMTHAVTEALRERLQRVQRQRRPEATVAELIAIGRRCANTLKGKPIDHGALLY